MEGQDDLQGWRIRGSVEGISRTSLVSCSLDKDHCLELDVCRLAAGDEVGRCEWWERILCML